MNEGRAGDKARIAGAGVGKEDVKTRLGTNLTGRGSCPADLNPRTRLRKGMIAVALSRTLTR